jgi:tRNA(Ile)-lysidine synthase
MTQHNPPPASVDRDGTENPNKTIETANLVDSICCAGLNPNVPVVIAFSGGADSTALLLACVQLWALRSNPAVAMQGSHWGSSVALPPLKAIHIHHGLQVAADSFAEHCKRVCAQLGVPLHVEFVAAGHKAGESPEDAARIARYKAFAQVIEREWGGEPHQILLGQHADDQIETLLLALSRGAGLPGLSCMAPSFERLGVNYFRPFLTVSSASIKNWLHISGQDWIEDPTNQDTQFTRNKIRLDVLPSIYKAFPAFRQTAARSAKHAAQAQILLNELALEDLKLTGNPPKLKVLQTLSEHRCANVLRFWFSNLGTAPSNTQLQELISQVRRCTTRGHKIEIKLGHGFVRRSGDVLEWFELLQ